jgi:hypothetical protein
MKDFDLDIDGEENFIKDNPIEKRANVGGRPPLPKDQMKTRKITATFTEREERLIRDNIPIAPGSWLRNLAIQELKSKGIL